jgi:hypothetical protein
LGFALVGYFLKMACSIFMPEVVTVLALLLEASVFVGRVPHDIA